MDIQHTEWHVELFLTRQSLLWLLHSLLSALLMAFPLLRPRLFSSEAGHSDLVNTEHYVRWASHVVLLVKNQPANAGDMMRHGFHP